jgi:uncharacterized protein YoxC
MTTADGHTSENGHLQALLTAEEAACELLTQLQRLRAETEHYGTARVALEDVSRELKSASGTLGTLGERVGLIIETLRSIGTAELLAGQDRVSASVSTLADKVANLDSAVGGQVRAVNTLADNLRTESGRAAERHAQRQQEITDALGRLPTNTAFADLRGTIEQAFAAEAQAREVTAHTIPELNGAVAKANGAIASLRRMVTVWSLVLLAAIGGLAVMVQVHP